MAEPIFRFNPTVFNSYAMATSGDATSGAFEIKELVGFSVQVRWSGASATDADVLIQGSNDGINFSPVSTINIGAASGSVMYNLERAMFSHIRVVFDKNSETTGLLTVILAGKSA